MRAERTKEQAENAAALEEVQSKVGKETLGDIAALAKLKEALGSSDQD